MAGEQKPSSNLLEQFILLAKGTSGSALTALISQVLEAPGVYVFGELLELANVQEETGALPRGCPLLMYGPASSCLPMAAGDRKSRFYFLIVNFYLMSALLAGL
uniref:COP9 signalosome subunit 7B n=1 Tax=Felis catus TaxID=9685 RepID=A0ABI7ZD20_FELCA